MRMAGYETGHCLSDQVPFTTNKAYYWQRYIGILCRHKFMATKVQFSVAIITLTQIVLILLFLPNEWRDLWAAVDFWVDSVCLAFVETPVELQKSHRPDDAGSGFVVCLDTDANCLLATSPGQGHDRYRSLLLCLHRLLPVQVLPLRQSSRMRRSCKWWQIFWSSCVPPLIVVSLASWFFCRLRRNKH